MRLLSGPLSLFTGKVRIALDEKQVACTIEDVPFSRAGGYDPKPAEVVQRNPRAQVPVLIEDDGFTVYDSTLILQYLEDRFPKPPLYPRDVRARARCRQLEAAADEELFPHVWTLIRERFYQPDPAKQDAPAADAATQAMLAHQQRVDASVGEEWLVGDAFTVADIGYFMTFDFARRLGVSIDGRYSRLSAWWERANARPSIERERARLDAAAMRVLVATASAA